MAVQSLVVCVVMLASICSANAWKTGRATFYGMDGWSIHKGSCGFGYQWPNVGTGFDVAAVADAAPEFGGSCGRCYEVKCDPQPAVPDGYSEFHDRSTACYDSSKTIVVRTVDNCPCEYPTNAYSNKRWCCYDHGMTHFDLSVWAFERLGDTKWGVMGIQYQEVPCTKTADNPAPPIANPTPPELPQEGMVQTSADTIFVKRFDSVGGPQGAVTVVSDPSTALPADIVPYSDTFHGGEGSSTVANASTTTAVAVEQQGCSDVEPTSGTCQQQKDWGKCNDEWLTAGSFCQSTCGHCGSPIQATPSPAPASPASGDCLDQAVPSALSWGSCQDQKDWGKCQEQWMIDGSYCAATCNRCGEAPPAAPPAACVDVSVPGQAECGQQLQWGKCSEVVANGYCKSTCGACSEPSVQAYSSVQG